MPPAECSCGNLQGFRSRTRAPSRAAAWHKCASLREHSFCLEVHLTGEHEADTGRAKDFADAERALYALCEQLEYPYHNGIDGPDHLASERSASSMEGAQAATAAAVADCAALAHCALAAVVLSTTRYS